MKHCNSKRAYKISWQIPTNVIVWNLCINTRGQYSPWRDHDSCIESAALNRIEVKQISHFVLCFLERLLAWWSSNFNWKCLLILLLKCTAHTHMLIAILLANSKTRIPRIIWSIKGFIIILFLFFCEIKFEINVRAKLMQHIIAVHWMHRTVW